MDEEGGLKQERRKQYREDQVFGQSDLRRKRQDREGDPRHNQADAVRETQPSGQHRHDSGDQKQ